MEQTKFGFGCMRFPMNGDQVDTKTVSKMVNRFIEEGFTYFDTAHGYLSGKSETALKECLTSRYPREAYTLTNKLTENYFQTEEDIKPLFEKQLEACGVTYFDYYLMHAQNAEAYKKFQKCHAYEAAQELKKEGKVRHVGISFHDRASVLDQILTEHPEVEVVQIQFNYVDYEDPGIESRKCYEVCVKHNKPVIVMEPVKGGSLVNLPGEAKKIFDDLHGGSYASYAIRFAADFPQIKKVLSGMGSMEMLEDNMSFMKEQKPLTDKEKEAIKQVCAILKKQDLIPCTACHYCTDGCPKQIPIPDLFADMNAKKAYKDWNSNFYYSIHTHDMGKASDCIHCGKCEKSCPQHLKIRDLLEEVAEVFEPKDTLVAYFSCSGVTEKAAKELAEQHRADLFGIDPVLKYTREDLDWTNKKSRSTIEMNDPKNRPEIKGKVENMQQYHTIYLGFPIWWYVEPKIIDTFLESYDFTGKTIIPFATSGGSGFGKSLEQMKTICNGKATWEKGQLMNK